MQNVFNISRVFNISVVAMWMVLLCSCVIACCVPVQCRTITSRVSFGSGIPSEIYKLEQSEVVRTVRQNRFPFPPPPPLLPIIPPNFSSQPNVNPTTYKPNTVGANNLNQGVLANQGFDKFNINTRSNFNQQGISNNGANNFNTHSGNQAIAGENSINLGPNNYNANTGLENNFNQGGNNFNNAIGNQPSSDLNNRNSFDNNNQFTGSPDLANFGPIEYSYNGNGRGRDENVMVSVPGGYSGESVKGSFSYKGSDGHTYNVAYMATSDGFNLQANKETLPVENPSAGLSTPVPGAQISTALLCSLQGTCI